MSKKLTFKSKSSMFSLAPPDGCSCSEEIYWLEYYENDSNPCEEPGKHWEIDGKKYLEDYLAPNWCHAFQELVDQRTKPSGVSIEITYTGTYSPREYNFETDHAYFDLEIAKADLKRIYDEVFLHEFVFAKYLKEKHSNRSGYISFVPNNIDGWKDNFWGYDWPVDDRDIIDPSGWDDKELAFYRAAMVLLDFYFLAYEEVYVEGSGWRVGEPSMAVFESRQDDFRQLYDKHLEDASCNGAVSDCFYLVDDEPGWYDAPVIQESVTA